MGWDYTDDPFKAMVRHYDEKIVAKGGRSLFALKLRSVSGPSYPRPHETGVPERYVPRVVQKPGRLFGHITGILGSSRDYGEER